MVRWPLDVARVAWLKLTREPIHLHLAEILFVLAAVRRKRRCKLLVFGAGNDSGMWQRLNRGGRTAFLEDDSTWQRRVLAREPSLEVHAVRYATRASEWREALEAPERLRLDLPAAVRDVHWDVILVDGPRGFRGAPDDDPPGRASSIFMARQLIAPRGDVFVHDCERALEAECCERFLGRESLRGEVTGRALLRHYRFDSRA